MTLSPRWAWVPAIAAGWLAVAGAAVAATPGVNDRAGFFKPETVQKADTILRDIKNRHQKEVVVETFESVPAGKEEQVKDRADRERFFDEWAKRNARNAQVTGIYILICRHPGHVEIEVGNETSKRAFTPVDRRKLNDLLVRAFKEKDYDEGLLRAVRFIQDRMNANLGNRQAAAAKDGQRNETHGVTPGAIPSWTGWLCIGVVALLGIWLFFGLIRAFTGAGRGGYGGGGYGGGGPGGGGYGGGGGGGGFMSGLLGGMFGAVAGNWMYNNLLGGGHGAGWGSSQGHGADPGAGTGAPDTDYQSSGGDFGDDTGGSAGGDTGGGGDFGGGDFGGGGGDFGGGGGDFGGGGGDFGGGGGDF